MELEKIFRGMSNGAEAIEANFKQLSKLNNDLPITGLLNVGKQVWSGAWYGGEGQTITPSIPLSECLTGWVVTYQPYDSKTGKAQPWDTNHVFIPKTHPIDFSGIAVVHHLETLNGSKYNKYFYVTDKTIKGHKNNSTASKDYVVVQIRAI
ncbi:TPA: hypothetical protein IUD88_001172 [Enterococcus faecalis]|nr:hypothetical protein [Enterococcus faecalis]HBI2046298.1 hypothetical protein [Enterococcus faecalis]